MALALMSSAEMHELSRSADSLKVQPPKFSTFGPQQGRAYQHMFGNERRTAAAAGAGTAGRQVSSQDSSNSSSIFTMFRNAKPLKPTAESSQRAPIPSQQRKSQEQNDNKNTSAYSAVLGTGTHSAQVQKATSVPQRPILKTQVSAPATTATANVMERQQSSSSTDDASLTDSPRSRAKFVAPSIQAKQHSIAAVG